MNWIEHNKGEWVGAIAPDAYVLVQWMAGTWYARLFGPCARKGKRFWNEEDSFRAHSHREDAQREGETLAKRYRFARFKDASS